MDRSNSLPLPVSYIPLTIRHILWHVGHFSSPLCSFYIMLVYTAIEVHSSCGHFSRGARAPPFLPVKRSTIFVCLSDFRPSIVPKASHGVSERAIRPRGFALPRNFPACAASRPQTGRKPRGKLTRNGANQR